ncbi:protein of unknown function DUF1614 [Methanococcoides burtonii DSM 6242]|uniref:DUF1614 domain-containing protein n=2 Tax=Methanococcoides burtonii TaxID=29291 RepID=Q12XV6_METBU|nr:protein of unknown function DUF1614 [Methanococcoides burtonii DSM 6242]
MRGHINNSEIRMFLLFGFMLLPMAVLCYQQELSLSIITSLPLFLILVMMLVTANIDIPVSSIKTKKVQSLDRDALILEELFSVPLVKELSYSSKQAFNTVVSLNLGGFIIPFFVLIFLIVFQADFVGIELMLIMMLAVIFLSDFRNGIGVVVPDFIGILAIPFALIFSPDNLASVIFISGIGGILLGSMVTLLMVDREKKGSALIDVGGVGTFKAIYVTAILASLVSWFL